jgi:antitoxin VapB
MQRKAKIFMNNRSQAVRLPKEFQFRTQEVFIRKEGSEVVLSPRPFDWTSYLTEAPVASAGFMEEVEDLPVQERESNAALHVGHRHLFLRDETLK